MSHYSKFKWLFLTVALRQGRGGNNSQSLYKKIGKLEKEKETWVAKWNGFKNKLCLKKKSYLENASKTQLPVFVKS